MSSVAKWNSRVVDEVSRLVSKSEAIPTKDALNLILAMQAELYQKIERLEVSQADNYKDMTNQYLEIVKAVNDRLDKQDERIQKVKDNSIGIKFAEHPVAGGLLVALFIIMFITAQDVVIPLLSSALGLP